MSNTLSKYFFAESPLHLGAGFIICTEYPYLIGKVWKFKTESELEMFTERVQLFSKVKDYNILITPFAPFFNLEKLPLTQCNNISEILSEMADFYLQGKIEKNKGYFRRYSAPL